MRISLKKKLSAALLAGCSVIAFSSVSFAAEQNGNNFPPPPPPQHQQMQGDFDNRPMPPGAEHKQYKAEYKEYCEQLSSKYSWLGKDSTKRLAMNYVSIDKALSDNKLSENQATSLKKQLVAFYKESEKYVQEGQNQGRDDRRGPKDKHARYLSLDGSLGEISQETNIPIATLQKVLRPHKADRRDFQPSPPQHQRGQQMQDRADKVKQHFEKFTNELVSEGKVTREEVDTLNQYMKDSHDKFAQMSDEERSAYIDKVKNLSDDERLAKISQDTGISADRLKAIFDAAKEKMDRNPGPPAGAYR